MLTPIFRTKIYVAYVLYLCAVAIWGITMYPILCIIGVYEILSGRPVFFALRLTSRGYIALAEYILQVQFKTQGTVCKYCILTPTHHSHVDGIFILALAPNTTFIYHRKFVTYFFYPFIRLIPVGRESDDWLAQSVNTPKSQNICIFPQGTRADPDSPVGPIRSGFSVIARHTNRRICPVILNAGVAWGRGAIAPISAYGKTVCLKFLKDIEPETTPEELCKILDDESCFAKRN